MGGHFPHAGLRVGLLALLSVGACNDPFGFNAPKANPPEVCAASQEWLPNTPAVEMFKPLPHPASECPFYRGGWQNFLIATQPDAQGRPAFLSYPNLDTVFQRALPHPANRALLGGISQAGGRQVAIDQNGNTLYYGIHVNQAFADFVRANGMQTADGIRNAVATQGSSLFFPAGVVEFKSAWQVVEAGMSEDGFIVADVTVPTLHQDPTTHKITEDADTPRTIRARLLALHVVYTLPGHPELIWASFEHSDGTPDTKAADGHRDVAPIHPGDVNPSTMDPAERMDSTVVSMQDFILYKAGTTAQLANRAITPYPMLDEATQKFPGQQTSIYRVFPGSKSDNTDPDPAVSSLNHNVEVLFSQASLPASDRRGNYRLLGAQWLDKPQYFTLNAPFQNDSTSPLASSPNFAQDLAQNGSDSVFSITGGEDRMSSTAMESFTQSFDTFPNCLSCHNTQAITDKGVPVNRDTQGTKLLDPSLLNVSHVFSEFVRQELEDAGQLH